MVLAQYIQEIQTLILSFHPLLVIETVEEERVEAILQQSTQDWMEAVADKSGFTDAETSHGIQVSYNTYQ